MVCRYFKRMDFWKRLTGIKGYCQLQQDYILRSDRGGRIPYTYCEGIKGKCHQQCGVFVEHTIERSKVEMQQHSNFC